MKLFPAILLSLPLSVCAGEGPDWRIGGVFGTLRSGARDNTVFQC